MGVNHISLFSRVVAVLVQFKHEELNFSTVHEAVFARAHNGTPVLTTSPYSVYLYFTNRLYTVLQTLLYAQYDTKPTVWFMRVATVPCENHYMTHC